MVRVDQNYYRPTEVNTLLGDASKARKELNWVPKITVEDMIEEMVENDLKEAVDQKNSSINNGFIK